MGGQLGRESGYLFFLGGWVPSWAQWGPVEALAHGRGPQKGRPAAGQVTELPGCGSGIWEHSPPRLA